MSAPERDPGSTPDPADATTFEPAFPDLTQAPPARHRALDADSVLGSYRLIQILGRGASGEVWQAESLTTGRRLALKVLTGSRSPSPDLLERFKREGRLAGSLNHPRCVFAFGAEEIDGYPAITMELMSGGTLKDRLDESGPIPAREAVDLILDVIEGLEAAQRAGIIHRDIKPSNCFLDEAGRCKIGDFGISKSFQAPVDLTLTGAFIGTPSYASPEQVRGRELDFRSDIYSAGATLYALVTGKPPFHGGPGGEVLARIVGEDPIPFSNNDVDVPKGLQRAIFRAMEKDQEKRFKNYSELRAALLPFSSHGLTAGSLFGRFIAYQIDSLPLILVSLAARYLAVPTLLQVVPSFLYFSVSEKIWGRTLGKYLLRLRVTTTSGAPLTVLHAVLRAGVWVGLRQLTALAPTLWPSLGRYASFSGLMFLIAFVTARARNGYAGVHELLSGTRVMSLTIREAHRVPELQFPAPQPHVLQSQRFGPYVILGSLWQSESAALLAGQDELLNRPVWILDHTRDTSRPMDALTEVRPGRLRWLQGSRSGPRHWDAYEAPAGISLVEWVSEKGHLAWADMRAILLDVTREINARIEQGGIGGGSLSVSDVWIDSNGTARLLGFPAPQSNARPAPGFSTFSPQEWASFLHEMTYFGLMGRCPERAGSESAVPGIPMPEHARSIVNRICGVPQRPSVPIEVIEGLRRTANRPARLTRLRRAGPAAVLSTLFLIPAFGAYVSIMTLTLTAPWWGDLARAPQYRDALRRIPNEAVESNRRAADALRKVMANGYAQAQSTAEGRQFLSALPPEVRQDLEAAAKRYPQLSEAEMAEARRDLPPLPSNVSLVQTALPGMAAVVWLTSAVGSLLMAAALGTGPLFRGFQMSLQSRNGRRAGRIRCLVRAAVAWSPILLVVIWFLAPVFVSRSIPRLQPSLPLLIGMIAITVGGLVYNLVQPERGIPDMVAGTYVVPA